MAAGNCSPARFQIHSAPSPMTTRRAAVSKPRRRASRYARCANGEGSGSVPRLAALSMAALQRALLAVAAVPALGQRAVGALHVAGGQVVEHQRVLSKVPLGEPLLDGGLPLDQPVHRRVELMRIDVAESEQFAQGGYRALGGQRAGGGQFRPRVDDAGDDERDDQVAEAAGATADQRVQSELLEGAEHGSDVAVGQAADAGEGVVGIDELLTAEDAAQHIDGGVGQLGEIGEGALLDAAAVAVGLSEEDGGRRGAVGHALDIHVHLLSHITPTIKN